MESRGPLKVLEHHFGSNLNDYLLHRFPPVFRTDLKGTTIFRLARCYQKAWLDAPEDARAGRPCDLTAELNDVLAAIKKSYPDVTGFFNQGAHTPAIVEPHSSKFISHDCVYNFVRTFHLPLPPVKQGKPVVVIALPTGPILALACLAVAAHYTAAPLASVVGSEQFVNEVLQLQATAILIRKEDVGKLNLDATWITENGISVMAVNEDENLTFRTSILNPEVSEESMEVVPNAADDIALVLFTSGTSGKKKVVPLTLHTILTGVAFVIESWGLSSDDCCLNMMPLNHVGGLIRNLFAPVMAGGSTICCSGFDANFFWDLVENQGPTWYYASPTMHAMILAESEYRAVPSSKCKIRLVCNAAGGLLPSLATNLRNTFQCTVLPSYGMTECMPIATPPLTYGLDRPGTSGKSVGPEIAIMNISGNAKVATRETGRICVRGFPVFPGYLRSGLDKSSLAEDGWFDTGDLGYLDEDAYLYITGRGKEVINRGGEIISPFEIEDAILKASQSSDSPIFSRILDVMVFSIPHDVLQEVVGVVLVTRPGKPRPDLRQLHQAIKHSLHQPKWPVGIVYMDALPKARGKILRIRMAERLGLWQFTDEMLASEAYVEADCPPLDTPISQNIPSRACVMDIGIVRSTVDRELKGDLTAYVCQHEKTGHPRVILFQHDAATSRDKQTVMQSLEAKLPTLLHGYLVPRNVEFMDGPIPRTPQGSVDQDSILATLDKATMPHNVPFVERKVREVFSLVLGCSPEELSKRSDFFEMGGDSMKAGRLFSILRKEFRVQFPSNILFANSTIGSICDIVEETLPAGEIDEHTDFEGYSLPGCDATYSSTNPLLLMIQLIPISLIYPMRLAFQWLMFIWILSVTVLRWPFYHLIAMRLIHLVVAILAARWASHLFSPIVAIAIKWLVIGRIKEGIYPMWGPYHTRWWFVHKVLLIGGKGAFNHFNWTRKLYFRLLGARIGKGTVIHKHAILSEYDLLDIGDNVTVDNCICRPFAVERNTSMLLQRIRIGCNSSIGLKTVIAPGTVLAPGTCIGPNSSSWETEDATEANRDLSSSKITQPHWLVRLLFVEPLVLLIHGISALPWLAGLVGMVIRRPKTSGDVFREIAYWFTTPIRFGYHYLARVLGVVVGPMVFFLLLLIVKRLIDLLCGPEKHRKRSQLKRAQFSLMERLIPNGDPKILSSLFGSHYELTSVVIRLLGGRVGSRVYWPGVGPTIQDFSLVSIGNDVVFGSRSHIVTSDGLGSEPIVIGDGAMIADRTIILPGTEVGRGAILGTGTLTRRNRSYPSDSVWVGSKEGEALCLTAGVQKPSMASQATLVESPYSASASVSDDTVIEEGSPPVKARMEEKASQEHDIGDKEISSTMTPYGRAFYEKRAPYYVLGTFGIFLYSTFITIFTSIYWNTASIVGVKIVTEFLKIPSPLFRPTWFRPFIIYAIMVMNIAIIMTLQAVLALAIIIAAKWIVIGRRHPGRYDWDQSSYCQRWQLFLSIERLRSECYAKNGIIKLISGTHFLVLYFRFLGAKIGKDCALFAGGQPSVLFTEPDLLTLGDRVAVDDASLVCHLNTRGRFSLHQMSVGDRSVLRTGSRLLAGAQMMDDACLLEHTLIMSGDIVEQAETYQGWPASPFKGKRV
ncbi:predicted protein [Uncinocarpus reesii 1704]|uniref:Carrier domain-containing protein n=1 Tax=Uncinocarpus reesii (strain UAMH 1704) TaxID=336963 RepID=C4JVV5_UNCRE|nr:uncharacterized protein UREG_06697 [Uncinocarpus reesii 1704]EEP81832.1 predicted protein [Uncinocarpus reesii 1704]